MNTIAFLPIGHPDYVTDGTAVRFADTAAKALMRRGVNLIKTDSIAVTIPDAREKALALLREDVDGVILFPASWVECSVALAAVRELEHLPICLWSFPMWMEGEKECSTGSYVSGAMLEGVFRRMGLSVKAFFGMPDDPAAADHVSAFCRAAVARKRLRRCRIGLVGYTSMNILTGTFDHLLLRSKIGPDVEQSDSYSLIRLAEESTEEELEAACQLLESRYAVSDAITKPRLRKAMGIYVALMKLKERQSLDAVNIKCQYEFSKEYGMTVCVPLSLAASENYTTSCEGDMFCTVSQLLLSYLTGQIVAYGDAIHDDGTILRMSPCGYMPGSLTAGKCEVIPFPDGFGFEGLMTSCVMKPGKVTLLRLVEDVGSYHFLMLTGEGLADTKRRQGLFPALSVKADGDLSRLRELYAGQHFAICYGDVTEELTYLAAMLGIGVETI